jgi:hypothetical protein
LEFAYEHEGKSIFPNRINKVDLFIFENASGKLVYKETVNGTHLTNFAGIHLNHLEPGEYRVVAWGNTGQRSSFSDLNLGTSINDAYVGRLGVPRSTETHLGDGDRLHFASDLQQQSTLVVPQFGDVAEILPFSRAYIEIDVYVLGYERAFNETQAPFVEIGGVSSHYDFDRIPSGDITLREQSVYQNTLVEQPALAQFRTKLFDIDRADMTKKLRIHSAVNNRIVFTLENARLKSEIARYMSELGIESLEAGPDMVIPIIIVFWGGGDNDNQDVLVSVTIPEFELKPVLPEF